MLLLLVAGIQVERLKEEVKDEALLRILTSSFTLLQVLSTQIANEYWSVSKDIAYWRRVAAAGPWEAYYITYYNQGPRKLCEHLYALLLHQEESVINNINYSNEGTGIQVYDPCI